MSNVSEYYDQFSTQQVKTNINKRHRSIFNWLVKFGMQKDSSILEVGCGIGTVTELIAKYVKNGQVLANDISPKSIEIASNRLKRFSNVKFVAGDITQIKIDSKFDVVVMPDVIEHIPVENHGTLFKIISGLLKPKGFILIHIPNPYYLKWLRNNEPDKLQIIDQPIYTDILLKNTYPHGLYLSYLNTYSLWIPQGDYQLIVLRREKDAESFPPSGSIKTSILQKIKEKLNSFF